STLGSGTEATPVMPAFGQFEAAKKGSLFLVLSQVRGLTGPKPVVRGGVEPLRSRRAACPSPPHPAVGRGRQSPRARGGRPRPPPAGGAPRPLRGAGRRGSPP